MNRKDEIKRLKEITKVILKNDLKNGITPLKIYNILEELGPTFIKIGQILSTRIDIVPKEYLVQLSKLRSNVTPMSDEELNSILDLEYKDKSKIFKEINEVIGSGSIAQVNKATLVSDIKVVIKVCRKDVYEKMQMDVKLMKKAIKVLHLNKIIKIIDLNNTLDEILEVAYEESNFNIEKDHLIKFKKLNEEEKYISQPKVFSNISTNKVLVMEYVDGITLDKKDELIKNDYNLENISYILSDNYIKQALKDGFFHADPHPDNIMIRDGKIVFLDLGMMGTLKEKNKRLLNSCITKIIEEDYYEVSKILINMCSKSDDVDVSKLKDDIASILNEFSTSNLDDIDTAKFVSDMFTMLKKNNLVLDRDITMLVRGVLIIEATLENLNPNLSLISVLLNHTSNEESEVLSSQKILDTGRKIVKNTKSLVSIPNEVLTFFKAMNNGDNKIKFEMSGSKRQVDKIEKLLHELIIGIIDASLILALSNEQNELIRKVLIICIIILSLWLFIKMLIDHIHKGY